MRSVNNIGYFFSFTDKVPNPGACLYMTRGGIGVGNLLLNAAIRRNKVKVATPPQTFRDGIDCE